MLLTELFDKPSKWKWVHRGEYEASATFDVRNDEQSLKYFVLFSMDWNGDDWAINFGFKNPETGQIEFLDETRDFQSFTIFATIKSIIEDFIKSYNPRTFLFQGRSKLTNLYIRAFKRLLPDVIIRKNSGGIYSVVLRE